MISSQVSEFVSRVPTLSFKWDKEERLQAIDLPLQDKQSDSVKMYFSSFSNNPATSAVAEISAFAQSGEFISLQLNKSCDSGSLIH